MALVNETLSNEEVMTCINGQIFLTKEVLIHSLSQSKSPCIIWFYIIKQLLISIDHSHISIVKINARINLPINAVDL